MPKSGRICSRFGGCPFRSSKPSLATIIRSFAARANSASLASSTSPTPLQHSQAIHPDLVASPVDINYLKQVGLDHQFEPWRTKLAGGNG
ncbi:MAG TPA: hypothetical protein VF480_03370 [Verrucomicrobiae bacterium]